MGIVSRFVIRAQFLLPPCFLPSFPALWPALLQYVSWFVVYLLHENAPSLKAGILPDLLSPYHQEDSGLVQPSVRSMWDVLSGARSGVLVTKAGPREKKRYKARSWFFLGKNTAIATRKESILLKEHTPVSSQHRPGSCWGKETTFLPTISRYYQASAFCQYLGKPLSVHSATFLTQMQSGWEAEGSNCGRLWKNTTVIIYVMKRLISGCCAETRCDGTIPITLIIIIIKRAFTSHDKKLQI